MDTHPPNSDPQQPSAQPAAQVAAPAAGEQPAFDVQHAIATLDPKVLMELLENDANPVPPTRQPEPAALEPPAGEQPPVVPTEPDADRVADADRSKPRGPKELAALKSRLTEQFANSASATYDWMPRGSRPTLPNGCSFVPQDWWAGD